MHDKVLYLVHCETYEPALVRCLTRLHAVGCRELLLVHVPKTEEVLQHVPSLLKDALRHCLPEITRQQLAALAEPCQAQGITARSILTEGAFAWIEVQQLVQRAFPQDKREAADERDGAHRDPTKHYPQQWRHRVLSLRLDGVRLHHCAVAHHIAIRIALEPATVLSMPHLATVAPQVQHRWEKLAGSDGDAGLSPDLRGYPNIGAVSLLHVLSDFFRASPR